MYIHLIFVAITWTIPWIPDPYSGSYPTVCNIRHLHECLTDILMIKMYAHINSTTIGVGKSERAQNSPNSSSNNQNR